MLVGVLMLLALHKKTVQPPASVDHAMRGATLALTHQEFPAPKCLWYNIQRCALQQKLDKEHECTRGMMDDMYQRRKHNLSSPTKKVSYHTSAPTNLELLDLLPTMSLVQPLSQYNVNSWSPYGTTENPFTQRAWAFGYFVLRHRSGMPRIWTASVQQTTCHSDADL